VGRAASRGARRSLDSRLERGLLGLGRQGRLQRLRQGRLGDVIVSIEGKRVSSSSDVVRVLDELAPGRSIKVQLKRASQDLGSDKYDLVDLNVELASSGAMNYPMIAV
jgi:S1-C subfamily serine protease